MEIKTEQGVWFTRPSWDKPGTDAVFLPKKGDASSKHFDLERDADAYIVQQIVSEKTAELRAMLADAARQIEYLHEKFQETGSGNAVLARIESALLGHYSNK